MEKNKFKDWNNYHYHFSQLDLKSNKIIYSPFMQSNLQLFFLYKPSEERL